MILDDLIKTPPLSFPGNKKNYKTQYIEQLKKRFDSSYVFVDLFGGSGYLSYLTKHYLPDATVVYNDFDEYSKRIQNIEQTNEILEHIRNMIPDYKYSDKLRDADKQAILDYIREQEAEGRYIDYITLSSFLCFSNKLCSNYDEMSECYFYNKLKNSKLKCDQNYLNGLEIIHEDYQDVYNRYKDLDNVVFIIDPPYLASTKRVYKNNYWRLPDYFNIIPILQQQDRWFFFTNEEGCLIELLHYLDKISTTDQKKIMNGATQFKRISCCNYNAKFNDIMLVKGGKQDL